MFPKFLVHSKSQSILLLFLFLFFILDIVNNAVLNICVPVFCFLFFVFNLFIYLFIFGCVGSSFLCEGFL